jgi:lactate dehydrogenase-like 2-hydroxyacid dehydrogenase
MSKPLLLVHPPLPALAGRLDPLYEVLHLPEDAAARAAFFAGEAREVTAALVIGSVGLDNAVIAQLPALKLIAGLGAGIDGIDLAHAKARGVAVTNGAGLNADDVADVAIGLLLSAVRQIAAGDRLVRTPGAWTGPIALPPPMRLRGRKLGIVGLGAIGQAIGVRAAAFGLDIGWTGPRQKPDAPYPFFVDVPALAQWADILVVACPGGPETEHLVDASALQALGPAGVLVNVARGSVVDEAALIAALRAGAIAAAGLDVFAEEPTPAARWADVPNITLTPHLGGATQESLFEIVAVALENLRRHFAGEPLVSPV